MHGGRERLAPTSLVIPTTQALPLGLRHQLPQSNAETGQLVLYYNQRRPWTSTAAEGVVAPITQAVAKLLVASGMSAVPLW